MLNNYIVKHQTGTCCKKITWNAKVEEILKELLQDTIEHA